MCLVMSELMEAGGITFALHRTACNCRSVPVAPAEMYKPWFMAKRVQNVHSIFPTSCIPGNEDTRETRPPMRGNGNPNEQTDGDAERTECAESQEIVGQVSK